MSQNKTKPGGSIESVPRQRPAIPPPRHPQTCRAEVRDGWLSVDGCRIGRVLPGGVIEIKDKCRRRASSRGDPCVRVRAADLVDAVQAAEEGLVGDNSEP